MVVKKGAYLKVQKRKSPVNQRLTGLYCGERGTKTRNPF